MILYGISSCQSTYIQCTSYQNEHVQSVYAGDFPVGIFLLIFFKQSLRNTIKVLSSIDPDMAQRVGHVLDPNCCLQNVLLKFE